MIKLLHLITGLSVGGAETMLFKLLSNIDRKAFEPAVLSLTDIGPIGREIRSLGIPVQALGMRPRRPNPVGLFRLTRRLCGDRPDIVQTWMYHADLVGALGANLAGGIPTVWNIRHTDLSVQLNKRSLVWTAKACARISPWVPARIICCSEVSRRAHESFGYAGEKMQVIPNGFDLLTFKPDAAARLSVRQELGIPERALIIGLVARFNPQKDHRNFIQAAARVAGHSRDVQFLLCGDGVTWENDKLVQWIRSGAIERRCHLLGRRSDLPRLTAALDIATSSSLAEGFPNAIGEAMACGIPCVVTDVGDSAWIVGDTGKVVPSGNSEALAKACLELIECGETRRSELGIAARCRAEDRFNLPTIVRQYEDLYTQIAGQRSPTHLHKTAGIIENP